MSPIDLTPLHGLTHVGDDVRILDNPLLTEAAARALVDAEFASHTARLTSSRRAGVLRMDDLATERPDRSSPVPLRADLDSASSRKLTHTCKCLLPALGVITRSLRSPSRNRRSAFRSTYADNEPVTRDLAAVGDRALEDLSDQAPARWARAFRPRP